MQSVNALVIDDNEQNVNVLAQLLTRQGVACLKVLKPRHLESVLDSTEHVAVIFVDLEMPERSGYDVLEQLKRDPRFGATPIVAYTVHNSEVGNAHQHGFHSFLGKPLDAGRFPGQLTRILQGEPVWEPA